MAEYLRSMTQHLIPIVMLVLLPACSDVGSAYRVDTGIDPTYQDDEVRFRTTYYLRVFDQCPVDSSRKKKNEDSSYEPVMGLLQKRDKGKLRLVKDSLFRFRMTGQASALFSNLHFESGILSADEVDPFGKAVRDDEKQNISLPSSSSLKSYASAKGQEENGQDICPDGQNVDRKFFLIGPEGIKPLDRNDRLVMAMYTDAKPLIASLKQLAGHRDSAEVKSTYSFNRDLSAAQVEEGLSILKSADEDPQGLSSPLAIGKRIIALLGSSTYPIPAHSTPPRTNAGEGKMPADKQNELRSSEAGKSDLKEGTP